MKKLDRKQMAARVARDIPEGAYVNLGIGLPTLVADFMAGDQSDRGGVPLAAVDLNGDGLTEVITGAGEGSLPLVRFSDPRSATVIDEFAAEWLDYLGGVYVG